MDLDQGVVPAKPAIGKAKTVLLLFAAAIVVGTGLLVLTPEEASTAQPVQPNPNVAMCTLTSLDAYFENGSYGSEKIPCDQVGNRIVHKVEFPAK